MTERQRPRPSRIWVGLSLLILSVLYFPLGVTAVESFRTWVPSLEGAGMVRVWGAEGYRRLFQQAEVLKALQLSLWIGFWSAAASTVLGTLGALGLQRYSFRGKTWVEMAVHLPLFMPELVMGLSLLVWFVFLKMSLGSFSIFLAHVTFSLSYVILTVKARLSGLSPAYEDAARDLGATPFQVFWRVTFPLIRPAVASGWLMAFTLSFDDFLITYFTSGVESETLPLRIYSMIKFGVSSEVNALSTLLMAVTVGVVLVSSRLKAGFTGR